jgi:hypothetical protein
MCEGTFVPSPRRQRRGPSRAPDHTQQGNIPVIVRVRPLLGRARLVSDGETTRQRHRMLQNRARPIKDSAGGIAENQYRSAMQQEGEKSS